MAFQGVQATESTKSNEKTARVAAENSKIRHFPPQTGFIAPQLGGLGWKIQVVEKNEVILISAAKKTRIYGRQKGQKLQIRVFAEYREHRCQRRP